MRKLAFVALLLWGAIAHAQSDSQAVNSFKTMVSNASKITQFTEVDKVENNWVKRYIQVSDVKYDVKKTNSAINPLMGEVSLLALQKMSPPYSSKEQAQNSTDMMDYTYSQKYSITYQLDGNKWKASKVIYDAALIGGTVPGKIANGMTYTPKAKADMSILDRALEKWLPGMN